MKDKGESHFSAELYELRALQHATREQMGCE